MYINVQVLLDIEYKASVYPHTHTEQKALRKKNE